MSNDNTIPSITIFNQGEGSPQDYVAPVNKLTGANNFTAAALFRIRSDEGEGVIWSNEANDAGWAIFLEEDGVLKVRVVDSAMATIEASVQLGPVEDPAQGAGMYVDRWILAHLVKAETELLLYVNGVVVATTAMPNAAAPSTTGRARVGLSDEVNDGLGDQVLVGGVAYHNQELEGEAISAHFTSCVMARSLAPIALNLGQSTEEDFTNRWTAGDLVDPAFPGGTLSVDSGGDKVLSEAPPGAQLWQPRAGTVVLTKESDGEAPGPGQPPIMFSVKNAPWYAASAGAGGGGGGACGTPIDETVPTSDAVETTARFSGAAAVVVQSINTQNGPQESVALAWTIDADDDGAGGIRIRITGEDKEDIIWRVCAEALEVQLLP